jgi:hypothetical protein
MTIRLQTAKATDIPNLQFSEVSAYERNWSGSLPSKYPEVVFRTDVSGTYNCHGLTFASRRTRIPDSPSIALIINHDRYELIKDHRDVKPGDVVIYYGSDGDPSHSGIVLENTPPVLLEDTPPVYSPLVLSKWGSGPEAIHSLRDVPSLYGENHQFFRCRL